MIHPHPASIPRVKVASSNIAQIGYDAPSASLSVLFNSGDLYLFPNVPPTTHSAFLHAKSKGHFFHTAIKPRFPAIEVPPTT